MAGRKSRSVTFTTPPGTTVKEIRDAISHEIGADKLQVLQQLTNGEYQVETTETQLAEKLINHGFDCQEIHVSWHLPRGHSTNVSIMGLRAYNEDDDILAALRLYGEIKGDVIRLKYKADHDLAGLENGNCLVRMILTKPSIPYSLKIALYTTTNNQFAMNAMKSAILVAIALKLYAIAAPRKAIYHMIVTNLPPPLPSQATSKNAKRKYHGKQPH